MREKRHPALVTRHLYSLWLWLCHAVRSVAREMCYDLTFTTRYFFRLPAVNVILALPVTFFAFMVNTASPLVSVVALFGEIDKIFFPALLIFTLTSLFSTGQSSSPVSVTVTL